VKQADKLTIWMRVKRPDHYGNGEGRREEKEREGKKSTVTVSDEK
jgi:hypothetical protein